MYRTNQNNPDPLILQFFVKKISFSLVIPCIKLYNQSKELFCPSSLITFSDKLHIILLTICEKTKNNNHYNAKKAKEITAKFKANRMFFKKNLKLKNNESNDKSESKFKDDKLENNSKNPNQSIYKIYLENSL